MMTESVNFLTTETLRLNKLEQHLEIFNDALFILIYLTRVVCQYEFSYDTSASPGIHEKDTELRTWS